MKKVLMDLHVCFGGYAGIPQDARVTLALLAESKKIEVGGHLLGSPHGTTGFPWHDAKTKSEQIDLMSKYLIALRDYNRRYDWGVARSTFLRKRLYSIKGRNPIYKIWQLMIDRNWVHPPGNLHEIDSNLFADFIWREMLEKSLPLINKESTLSKKYVGGSISRAIMESSLKRDKGIQQFETSDYDFYLSQMPFPGKVSDNSRLVVRFHDAVPIQFPNTIESPYSHNKKFSHALKLNSTNAYFACNSQTTREQLLSFYPHLEKHSGVAYCCVPNNFEKYPPSSVTNIIFNRVNLNMNFSNSVSELSQIKQYRQFVEKKFNNDYFIVVSTIEPRKNYVSILEAWNSFRKKSGKDIKLVIVGDVGWGTSKLLPKFKTFAQDGNCFFVSNVPWQELIELYSNARATITASYFEGFSYAGIESMRCETPLVASNIKTHKEVYGDNAFYFDPYSVNDLSNALHQVTEATSDELKKMTAKAHAFSMRYSENPCREGWENLFLNAAK